MNCGNGCRRIKSVIDPLRIQLQDGRIIQLSSLDMPDLDPYGKEITASWPNICWKRSHPETGAYLPDRGREEGPPRQYGLHARPYYEDRR